LSLFFLIQKSGIRPPERPTGSAALAGENGSTRTSWCRIARARRTAHSVWNPVRERDALRPR
jgi:hypothetical protein